LPRTAFRSPYRDKLLEIGLIHKSLGSGTATNDKLGDDTTNNQVLSLWQREASQEWSSPDVHRLGMLNSLGAVILVLVAGGMVFNTLLFYGYMRTMPKEIEEAAVIDGASVH
jgi:ABC-type sugar transport system permease subunit